MTREEITSLFEKTFYHEYIGHSGYMVALKHSAWKFIDELADDLQSRTCENCAYFVERSLKNHIGTCSKFKFMLPLDFKYCNKFEREQNEN